MTPRRDKITDLAIIPERAEHQHFEEELTLLAIARTRIFRQAIHTDTHLDDMPDLADHSQLDEAFADLDQAAQGQDSVTAELAKWRQELEASR
jgi:fructose-bisphosphate aldolase class 1